MCCCVIETSLVQPWKSLAFFRNLWQYSQVFGKCLKTFAWSSITFEESLKIFGKCSEIFGKSSLACSYNKQNNTWLLVSSLLVFNFISYELPVLNHEISSWTHEKKFHIYPHPCFILYILYSPSIRCTSRSRCSHLSMQFTEFRFSINYYSYM